MAASDIRTEDVSFASNGDTANGYLARPAGDGRSRRSSSSGSGGAGRAHQGPRRAVRAGRVRALAPDSYHGQVATEPDDARGNGDGAHGLVAMREIRGAIGYLSD